VDKKLQQAVYGSSVTPLDVLQGRVPPPPEFAPLYSLLDSIEQEAFAMHRGLSMTRMVTLSGGNASPLSSGGRSGGGGGTTAESEAGRASSVAGSEGGGSSVFGVRPGFRRPSGGLGVSFSGSPPSNRSGSHVHWGSRQRMPTVD